MAESAERRPPTLIAIGSHPIYPMLLPVPIVCFIGALLADLMYKCSGGTLLWVNFSSWLLVAGLVTGAIAGIIFIIELIRSPLLRSTIGWIYFGLLLLVWIIEFINSLVHARDGWTAVVPVGLTLSAIAVVLSLVGGWLWQSLRYGYAEDRP
jgi:uncharacterized membrane protein